MGQPSVAAAFFFYYITVFRICQPAMSALRCPLITCGEIRFYPSLGRWRRNGGSGTRLTNGAFCRYNKTAPHWRGRRCAVTYGGWPTDRTPWRIQNRGEVVADVEGPSALCASCSGMSGGFAGRAVHKSVLAARPESERLTD